MDIEVLSRTSLNFDMLTNPQFVAHIAPNSLYLIFVRWNRVNMLKTLEDESPVEYLQCPKQENILKGNRLVIFKKDLVAKIFHLKYLLSDQFLSVRLMHLNALINIF